MIDTAAVTIQDINFSARGKAEVYENLRVLYTTPAGTVPFDRDFGIDMSILDESFPISQGRLIVEYIEKTRRFEPRASVVEVLFDSDAENGRLIPKVVVAVEPE
ncbi:hypothetical protein [Paenibacillus naphthalenovorans]|uniref:hypothetical protein n=1 Tax=Paenibacillus naphthalenovorans TaxID=162209 RepID=UPI003D2CF9BB